MNNLSSPVTRDGEGKTLSATSQPAARGAKIAPVAVPVAVPTKVEPIQPSPKLPAKPKPRQATTKPAPKLVSKPKPRTPTSRPTSQPTTRPASKLAAKPNPIKATSRPVAPASATTAPAKPTDLAQRMRLVDLTSIKEPVKVADGLFVKGKLRAALVMYETALKTVDAADMRAWVLFQMANCHRPGDPTRAIALYGQVAKEFPKSPWAPASVMLARLTEWDQTNTPRKTIKEIQTLRSGDEPVAKGGSTTGS